MPREMEGDRVFCKCLSKIILGCLYFLVLNKLTSAFKALKNAVEFLVMIYLIHFDEFILFKVLVDKWRGKKEG